MKLPTSNKMSFGKKPYVKKGYYPAQLLKVDLYADKDGNPKEGKYGRQLIFEFGVFKGDSETGAPIEPMTFQEDKKTNVYQNVVIPKFVYHQYKDKKNQGEFQTAITPNSAITRLLTALGWTFSTDDVDPEEFIGNWVEVNLDDYDFGEGDDKYTASTIKDINDYEGPEPSKDLASIKPSEQPKKVQKQVKHNTVKKKADEGTKTSKEVESKIEDLKKLNKDGFLTEEGLKQAIEQLEAKVEGSKE